MANLLYLVHRLPYPPNTGDKVRSCNLLKHLVKEHRVHLGTFIDDPDDQANLGAIRDYCADVDVPHQRILTSPSWEAHLTGIDTHLEMSAAA